MEYFFCKLAIDTKGKDIKRRSCPLLGVQATQDWIFDLNLAPNENLVLFSVLISLFFKLYHTECVFSGLSEK